MLRLGLVGLVVLASALAPGGAAALPLFIGLGHPPGGSYGAALAISADGLVVTGVANGAAGVRGFRWEAGLLTPLEFQGTAASADGSVIVGFGLGERGVRWEAGISTPIPVPGPNPSASMQPFGVSGDGSTVVGRSSQRAFRYQGGVSEFLGEGSGAAWGISADGRVIVGGAFNDAGWEEAFRWVDGELTPLGDLPGGGQTSYATATSSDGSVIVGRGVSDVGYEAFRWEAGALQGLGFLPGSYSSIAKAVSADGSIVVGYSHPSGPSVSRAFIWDTRRGMLDLHEVLAGLDLDVEGWQLTAASGISADGLRVVGFGINPDGLYEPWLAEIPEPASYELLVVGIAGLAMLMSSPVGARSLSAARRTGACRRPGRP